MERKRIIPKTEYTEGFLHGYNQAIEDVSKKLKEMKNNVK